MDENVEGAAGAEGQAAVGTVEKPVAFADGVPVYCSHDAIMPVNDLLGRKNPDNPNKHPLSQVKRIALVIKGNDKVKGNGWRQAVTISTRSGLITKGHGRLEACIVGNMKEAPVDWQHYDSKEAELADMVADNELPRQSQLDTTKTKSIIESMRVSGKVDINLTGVSSENITAMFAEKKQEGPEYPITARLNEEYDYVTVFTQNKTDSNFLRNLCGVRKELSYKNKNVGVGRVVEFDRFMDSLRANIPSLTITPLEFVKKGEPTLDEQAAAEKRARIMRLLLTYPDEQLDEIEAALRDAPIVRDDLAATRAPATHAETDEAAGGGRHGE